MKVTGKRSISNLLKLGLQIVAIIGIVVMIFLPFILEVYQKIWNIELGNLYIPLLGIMYLSGIPAVILLYQFIQLFDSLKKETPFIKENIKYLKKASLCSIIIAIEYIIGIFIFKSIFVAIIIGIFLIAWLGLYILAELFKQAVAYKEENDLTI